MKYKKEDKVRIKSLDWYNQNKDNHGAIYGGNGFIFWKNMARYCGTIMKIAIVKVDPEDSNKGYYFMENSEERWTDEMIEGLVEDETSIKLIGKAIKNDEIVVSIDEWNLPQGYQFKDENGNVIKATKIVLEKIKKEYPKTYEECLKVLGYDNRETYCICHNGANERLFDSLYCLKVCRDAYWKIAGEEMGLGKSWKPDWKNGEQKKYCIHNYMDNIRKDSWFFCNAILAFPSKEMRDAFYKNFKDLIEQCKELL